MTITIDPETATNIIKFFVCCSLMATLIIVFAMHLRNEADIRAEQAEARRLRELND